MDFPVYVFIQQRTGKAILLFKDPYFISYTFTTTNVNIYQFLRLFLVYNHEVMDLDTSGQRRENFANKNETIMSRGRVADR